MPAVDPDPAGPLDARPFIAEAHARYPDAKGVTVEGNAVVLVAMNDARLLPSAARFTRRVLLSYTHDRFGRFPSVPVYVLLFSTFDAFDRFSRDHYGVPGKENLGGYDAKTHQILVDASSGEPSLPTIAHELVHYIMREADFPRAPEWFSECVATVFESPRWADDGIHGAKWSLRYDLLKNTLASPATAPTVRFDTLFGMPDEVFLGVDPAVGVKATRKDPKLRAAARARNLFHEAIARYACVWLDDQGKLFPLYTAWRDSFATDRTGEKTFERIVGEPPAAVQARWAAWVKAAVVVRDSARGLLAH